MFYKYFFSTEKLCMKTAIRFDIFSPVIPSCKHQISGIKYSPSVQCLLNFQGIGITRPYLHNP